MVRRYRFQAAAGGAGSVSVQPAGATAKPPGSTLRGSVLELAVVLQAAGGGAASAASGLHQQQQQQQLPASAEEVVGCLQQLLGMVRVLAPPLTLLMRLKGVLLQASWPGACPALLSWQQQVSRLACNPKGPAQC